MMVAHHLLSFVAIGCGLATKRCAFFACMALCAEASTPFLNNITAAKFFGGQQGADSLLHFLSGIMLWITYVPFRMVNFPVWLWVWYSDLKSDPAETSQKCTWFELVFHPAVILLLLYLSSVWFVAITAKAPRASGKLSRRRAASPRRTKYVLRLKQDYEASGRCDSVTTCETHTGSRTCPRPRATPPRAGVAKAGVAVPVVQLVAAARVAAPRRADDEVVSVPRRLHREARHRHALQPLGQRRRRWVVEEVREGRERRVQAVAQVTQVEGPRQHEEARAER